MPAMVAAPVLLDNGTEQPAHLVDMRSRGGFSGSPVFIYRVPTSDLSRPSQHKLRDENPTGYMIGGTQTTRRNWFVGLLGIHCGQFWEPMEVRKGGPATERRGDPILEGDRLFVQGGMTIVAPAWRISDLLNSEAFETMRSEREVGMSRT